MYNNRMRIKTNAAPTTQRYNDIPEGAIPARVIMPDGTPMRYAEEPSYSPDPGYADDPYYDDYIADRIMKMRDIEKEHYSPAVNSIAAMMRSMDTKFMHELDDIRRQEMATQVEYNTQRAILVQQQIIDFIDDINNRLNVIEKELQI